MSETDPQVLSEILDRWRELNPRAIFGAPQLSDGQYSVETTLVKDSTFDLEDCSRLSVPLHLILSGRGKLTVTNLGEYDVLTITRNDVGETDGALHLTAGVWGTVRLQQAPSARPIIVTTDLDCQGRLDISQGGVRVHESSFSSAVFVSIYSGSFHCHGDWHGPLRAADERAVFCAVDGPAQPARLKIYDLTISGDTTLELSSDRQVSFQTIWGGDHFPTIQFAVAERDDLKIRVANLLFLAIESNAQVTISDILDASMLNVRGMVNLDFLPGGRGHGIRFARTDAGTPAINAGSDSIITDLAGEIVLGFAQGASITGSPSGYLIGDMSGTRSSRPGTTNLLGLADQAVLRGFRLPDGLAGRRLLTFLRGAYHLDPNTADLPGWNLRFRSRDVLDLKSLLLGTSPKRLPSADLYQNVELIRELQRLADEKGAPGSTRTTIGWCVHRLRHATTQGGIERVALSAYRLLGYGQRPGPSLLTWLVLAFTAASIVLGLEPDLSLQGAHRLASETAQQAFGPLAAVMRSGTPPATHDWEYVIRAIVAIPLVTGLLALRNYVRGEA